MAHAQLQLITTHTEELWKLDPRTIQVGRQGLAQARAALARSRRIEEESSSLHHEQATAA